MSKKEIDLNELQFNPSRLFGQDWCLIAAGNPKSSYNAMTIAWGQIGAIWDRKLTNGKNIIPTATVFIRPQRYTKVFFDREEYFTISAFPKQYKKALAYLGSHSGRDEDKIAKVGLTPCSIDQSIGFEEASLTFVCRKLYHAPLLESGFCDTNIVTQNYPMRDFHEMYIGEIIKVFVNEDIS